MYVVDDLRSFFRSRLLCDITFLLLRFRLKATISVGTRHLHKREQTFRLVLLVFESSFPPLAFDFDEEAEASFGLTVKKPSIRPCCFELTALASFSDDLRTRSSLDA